MKRLTAYVSGRVQEVGYGRKVARLAVAFGLKGRVEYLDDGRAKIIAEGDDERLKSFEHAIEIKEHLISVSFPIPDPPPKSPIITGTEPPP